MPKRPTINSLSRFVAEMTKLQRLDRVLPQAFWFRGHAVSSQRLLPGVLRDEFVARVSQFANGPQAAEKTEQFINNELRRKGTSVLPPQADPVEVYFLAQHHAFPTRLLDWSENPLAALFFAVSNKPECDGEVIAVIPDWRMTYRENGVTQMSTFSYPVDQRHQIVGETLRYLFDEGPRPQQPEIVPVRPDLRSGRMLQQGACFTLHMPGCPEVNESVGNAKRFAIPANRKPLLLNELRANGVNWASLFPDLDHLSKEIREDWGFCNRQVTVTLKTKPKRSRKR